MLLQNQISLLLHSMQCIYHGDETISDTSCSRAFQNLATAFRATSIPLDNPLWHLWGAGVGAGVGDGVGMGVGAKVVEHPAGGSAE